MDKDKAIEILAQVKGNWYRQPADDATIAVWADTLREVSFEHTRAAVRAYIAGAGKEPPTVGEIRQMAVNTAADKRRGQRLLDEPPPTEEEKAHGIAMLRQLQRDLGAKLAMPPNVKNALVQREPGED